MTSIFNMPMSHYPDDGVHTETSMTQVRACVRLRQPFVFADSALLLLSPLIFHLYSFTTALHFTPQAETETLLLNKLRTTPPIPPQTLSKTLHAQYLGKYLLSLPAPYTSLDASRPWLMYWCLHGFDLLGVALDQGMKDR